MKGLNYSDNYDGVVTHLEPDIPECEVKWTLGSITMNKAFLLCLSLLFFSQLFVWSPQTTILPFGNVMNLRPKLFWHSVCQIYFKIFFLLLPQFDGFIFIIYLKQFQIIYLTFTEAIADFHIFRLLLFFTILVEVMKFYLSYFKS